MRSWSAASFAGIENASTSTTVALGSILTRRIDPIDRSVRPLAQLNVIAKVTFGGELALRGDEAKRGYKGPLFQALPGDLIISKIRVGQGSFTLVPNTLDHLAVSPEYPVYALDVERIDGDYLSLILRAPEFLAQLTRSAAGNTTKQRVSPAYFESLRIPLSPLEDQQRMAAAHADAMAAAEALVGEAAQTETEALAAFEAALGLAAPAPLPDRPVFVARFRELDRWSHEAALRGASQSVAPDTWPTAQLGDVIADLENGWSPKCLNRAAGAGEWGVLKVSAVSRGVYDENENKALPAALSPRERLEVRAGDVLIARASGVARLVGVACHVEETRPRLLIADKIFRVVPRDPSPIRGDFLSQLLSLRATRAQIEREFSTKSGMMKNVTKPALKSLTFPLPPLETQKTLTGALSAARARAAELREQARQTRRSAWSDFEAAVASSAS